MIADMLRRFAIAFFATIALLGGIVVHAQGLGGHNTRAPVNFAADRIQLQDRSNLVVLAGNVDITQAGLNLRAARTLINYTDAGSLEIQRITATGGVTVTRGNESARGNVAIYDFNRRVITMTGNVRLQRGGDTLNGGRLTIDLQSGISSVDGQASGSSRSGPNSSSNGNGRVTGTFNVPQN